MASIGELLASGVIFTIALGISAKSVFNSSVSIIGGESATIGQFPYAVRLRYRTPEGYFVCNGALISNEWILSAAHCSIDAISGQVFLGSIHFSDGLTHEILPQDVIWHPDFDPSEKLNDICLIKIPFTNYSDVIKNIQLPYFDDPRTFQGATATAIGWGFVKIGIPADTLQYHAFRVLKNEICKRIYKKLDVSHLCLATTLVSSPCIGDSGAPLVFYDDSNQEDPIQIGVESFGLIKECDKGYPVVYTRVSFYLSWIRSVTGIERHREPNQQIFQYIFDKIFLPFSFNLKEILQRRLS